MCGRFTLRATAQEVAEHFRLFELPVISPRYNIGPGQIIGIVRVARGDDGSATSSATEAAGPSRRSTPHRKAAPFAPNTHIHRQWSWAKWGLVPHWADDPKMGNRLINARAETLTTRPAFRAAARYRRCLIPADGFYEWKITPQRKQPYFIRLRGDRLFGFAGLWEQWQSATGEILETCTILTVEPNRLMASLHNRMPLILSPDDYERWLDPRITEFEPLRPLVKAFPEDEMEAIPVSTYVNSIRHEGPQCLAPAAESRDLFGG